MNLEATHNANIKSTIKAKAEAAHAAYPQYKNHWNGWALVQVTKIVKTKFGVAFLKGEMSLGKYEPETGFWTVYSVSNKIDTSVNAKHVKVISA